MQRGGERRRSSVRGMAHVRPADRCVRHTADRQHAPTDRELVGEDPALGDLTSRRHAVRRRGAGMGGDDVPEQYIALDAELGEDTVDDRRCRLGRPAPGEEALRRERDPGDASAAIARRFTDEQDAGPAASVEIRGEPVAPLGSARAVPVEVRGPPDPGGNETVYERTHRDQDSDGRRPGGG